MTNPFKVIKGKDRAIRIIDETGYRGTLTLTPEQAKHIGVGLLLAVNLTEEQLATGHVAVYRGYNADGILDRIVLTINGAGPDDETAPFGKEDPC